MIEIFYPNKKTGKIEFTKEELEKVLNRVYDQGYEDGKSSCWTWTSPFHWNGYSPYYTTTTCATTADEYINTVTSNSNNSTEELKIKTLNDFSNFFDDGTAFSAKSKKVDNF